MYTTINTTAENLNNTAVINPTAPAFVPGTRLTREEIDAHTAVWDDHAPALYIGTYGKYAAGSLRGLWVALDSFDDVDDFFQFCADYHADEQDPEFMAQDFANVPRALYSECPDREDVARIIELFSDYTDEERAPILEYWDEVDGSADPRDILDRLVYTGDFREYADEMADELLATSDADETIKMYFDYEAFARDLEFDYTITENFVFGN